MKKVLLVSFIIFCCGLRLLNAQTANYTPIFGNALQFTGANSNYINCTNNTAIQLTGAYTLEAWINPSVAADMSIVEKYSAPCQGGYALRMNTARKIVAFTLGSPNTCTAITSATSVPLNQWTHVAVTYNAGTSRIYMNGLLDATLSGLPNPTTSTSFLAIGRRGDNSAALYFNGLMDELRIWNTERNATQLVNAMNAPLVGNEANLVAYYNMNRSGQGSGLSVNNNSTSAQSGGVAINGTTAGNATTPLFITPASSLDFDGINDFVQVNTNLLGTNNISIDAWVKPSLRTDATNFNLFPSNVISNDLPGAYGHGFGANIVAGSSGITVEYNDGFRFIATPLTPDTWYHIVCVYSIGNVKTFVNGTLIDNFNFAQGAIEANNYMYIGMYNSDVNNGTKRFFKGGIDEIRIWNKALSAGEVAAYNTCTIPTSGNNIVANYHFNQGIVGVTNSTITTLTDVSGNNNNGTLNGFALTNLASNWVNANAPTSGNCVNCSNTGSSSVIACNSYLWNNTTYTITGTYTGTFMNAVGCDSVHTLNLTIYPTCTASALAFNGNSNINCGTTLGNFGIGSFTVETWFKTASTATQTLISKRATCPGTTAFWEIKLQAGKIRLITNETTSYTIESPLLYNDNLWHHMACRRHVNSNGTLYYSIVVDGNMVVTSSISVAVSSIPNLSNTSPLIIGGASCDYFVGQLDETRIWNRALSLDEIKNNRTCEIPTTAPGLLANYHYNQGLPSGTNTLVTTLINSTGLNFNGVLTGFTLTGSVSNWVTPGGVSATISCPAYTTASVNYTKTECSPYVFNGLNYTASGLYPVNLTSSTFGDSLVNLNLTLNGLNAPTLTVNQSAPSNGNVTYTASGASTYLWTNGIVNGVPFPLPTIPATYFVTATDANGCTRTASVLSGYTASTGCYIPPDAGYTSIPGNDDGSLLVNLPFTFKFFNTNYTSCYINNNGILSFGASIPTWNGSPFPLTTPSIAPFWCDVDTRIGNVVKYKITPNALIVTWPGVGRYPMDTTVKNTFQVIISDGTDSLVGVGANVSFRYGTLQWLRGSASNTDPSVGYDAGDGVLFLNAPGSRTPLVLNFANTCNQVYNVSGQTNIPAIGNFSPLSDTLKIPCGGKDSIVSNQYAPESNQVATGIFNTNGLCATTLSSTVGSSSTSKAIIRGTTCNIGFKTITLLVDDNAVLQSPATLHIFKIRVLPNCPNLNMQILQPITCNNGSNGSIKATLSTPYNDYTYTLNNSVSNSTGIFSGLNAGTYTVTASNGAYSTTATISLVNPGALSGSTTLTACNTYTWNSITYTNSGVFLQTFTNSNGCDSVHTLNLTIQNCISPTVKCFLQGYYTGSQTMTSALFNQGLLGASINEVDSVMVELHNPSTPYALMATYKGKLSITGQIACTFPASANGNSYYIVVKNRNHVETWSANPVLLSTNTTYDFSTSSAQALGANQIEVQPNVWAFYSGDINQDMVVDAFDYLILDPDITNGASGYLTTDLTGDGIVDAFDYLIFDPNLIIGIGAITP